MKDDIKRWTKLHSKRTHTSRKSIFIWLLSRNKKRQFLKLSVSCSHDNAEKAAWVFKYHWINTRQIWFAITLPLSPTRHSNATKPFSCLSPPLRSYRVSCSWRRRSLTKTRAKTKRCEYSWYRSGLDENTELPYVARGRLAFERCASKQRVSLIG